MACSRQDGFDVTLVGLSCVDALATAERCEWYVQNPVCGLHFAAGGVGNALVALSGLGLRLGVATRIGRDLFGRSLLERWQALGVDIRGVREDSARVTGFAFVLNHDGERTPFFAEGAASAFKLDDIPDIYIKNSRWMLIFFCGALPSLDGGPMLELVRRCHAAGAGVILDLSDKVTAHYPRFKEILPYVNLVINQVEGERLTRRKKPKEILMVLDQMAADAGFKAVTYSNGAAVSHMMPNGSRRFWDIPSPFSGRPVMNVTGAGDAFRAGLAAYLCHHAEPGQSGNLDFPRAMTFAASVAYHFLARTTDYRPFSLEEIETSIKE